MTSIHLAPHRPLNVTAADFLSSVTGKEHPANLWIPNKDQDETVHVFSLCTVIISPISFTLAGCLQDSDETKAEKHPFLHQRDIDLRSQQSPDRKSEALMGTSRQCPKSLHKLDLGLSCIHATEFNQQLQVLFLTQPTLHAVTYNQRFGVTRAMLLLSQVLKFLVAPGKSLRIKRLLTNTAKISKGWHAM